MKTHRNAQEMKEHIDSWKASGLSKAAYTKQINLSYYTFLYWLDKLEPVKKTKGFSQVKINSEKEKTSCTKIEFHIPSKGYFVFPENSSATFIKSILGI